MIRGDIDYTATGTSTYDKNYLSAGINFSQELYNRASWLTLDTAEKTARQADATYAATQQDLILRVSQAYFEVLSAQDNLEFVRAEKAAVARQLEQTKQRFEVGLSAITDVHDAQAQYDGVLADEVNNLINSYESLREITGQEHNNLNVLDTERFPASRSNSSAELLIEEAKGKNLSLLSSRISQDIARDNISLASSDHLPTLTMDGGYNYSDRVQSSQNYTLDALSVGINLAVPLYSGGRITSKTKQAEFAYEQSVVSARSALEATEAGFDVGTRTIVDVLDATRRLYDANRNLSNARYSYILSIDAGLKPAK